MRAILYILVIIIAISSFHFVTKQDPEIVPVDSTIFAKYKKGYKESGVNLTLNDNWTFSYEKYNYSDCIEVGKPVGWISKYTGKFRADSNKILLIPEWLIEIELLNYGSNILDSLKYSEIDSIRIKTEFTIVKWTGNIYLLSEEKSRDLRFRTKNDFEKFADNYNSGSEPRWNEDYFCKRMNKERSEPINKNQIPPMWRDYFVDSIITLVVADIEENIAFDSLFYSQINSYELKGGKSAGVKEGMTFYGKDGCCIIKIMIVDQDKSYGLIELCPFHQDACRIGDTLTSWNFRDNGDYIP